MKTIVKYGNAKALGVSAVITALFLSVSGVAGATGTPITSGFANAQTSLTTYMGLAIALVIALVLLGAGIRFLAKWVKAAVSKN
jgi:predicted transporter